MAIVSAAIPNFINGVSQQPFALRLASQAEEQENGLSSVAEGLLKRPGTKHIARLQWALTSGAYVHVIQRDKNEKYIAIITNGAIRVFDFDGVEYTVTYPNGTGYLNTTDAANGFSATTVADFTFIVNKEVTVVKGTSTASPRDPEALVWVKQGSYGADYTVHLNNASWTYTTPNGETAADAPLVQTNHIAQELKNKIDVNGNFEVHRYGSVLWIRRVDRTDFTVRTEDSLGDLALLTVKDKVQDFTSLPTRAVNGFRVTLEGSPNNTFDTYYVQFTDQGMSGNDGVWQEVLQPGAIQHFNWGSMPHALIRQSDGTFTFEALAWSPRRCGDDITTPWPSFVDRKISDVFFFRNRLGFIADEAVVMSRSGEFFNLFRKTVTQIMDDDPIDLSVSHVKVSLLRHAIPFADELLLFSDQTQFTLRTNGQLLTPFTASITPTTEFEASLEARPVGAGRNVYFAINRGAYAGVREYYIDAGLETNDANDITAHCRSYVPSNVFKIAASTNEDTLVAISRKTPNKVYVYRWFSSQGEKLQSSWSTWTFDPRAEVLNVQISESIAWFVISRADGVFLEKMDIETGMNQTAASLPVHLDRRVGAADCTITYDAATKRSTIELPFWWSHADDELQMVAQDGNGKYPTGYVVNHEVVSGTKTITVSGDWTTGGFLVGRKYTFRFRFSPILLRDEAPGGGQVATTEGRLQLTFITLNYADSGYFRVEVTPFRRNTYTRTMSGRVVGSFRNPLGELSIETGTFRFPVAANNMEVTIDLINDTHLPCRFLNAEWEGRYTVRSIRRS